MSEMSLYTLSNKIRSVLLTTIDKEILINSKKNHLLINSQNQEQLLKKYEDYRDFTIKTEELFESVQSNEDENILYDLSSNYSSNNFTCFCRSAKTSNECLLSKNSITKSISPKKNNLNSCLKKSKNSEISENNLCKLKIDTENKEKKEKRTSFSCNEIVGYKNSKSLNKNKNNKHTKTFSGELYIYSFDNKSDDSLKLINYCYKLKKPNDEIINEISDDDTSTNKKNNKLFLLSHRIKTNHKSIPKKKLKKVFNKRMSADKNIHNNNDELFRNPARKKTTNFTNEMKLYFDNVEKTNTKEKLKNHYIGKKFIKDDLKKNDNVHDKNIFQLHHRNSKSSEKKSKGKKLEQTRKAFCLQSINKQQNHKNSQNLLLYFKSISNNPMVLKHKEKKEKTLEKNDNFITVNALSHTQSQRKQSRSSRALYNKKDEFQQNEIYCFGKKNPKNFVDKRNKSTKTKKIDINIPNIDYNNKNVHTNNFIENKQN